jgi:hypothetical protein
MKRIFRNNGLSIVLVVLFIVFWWAQSLAGHKHYNEEQIEHGQPTVNYGEYLIGNHFLEATMENWESEFLQMFAFVVLTVFLYQKGSAESKDPNAEEEVDKDPRRAKKKDSPLPVKKGGWILKLYEHSLSPHVPVPIPGKSGASCRRWCGRLQRGAKRARPHGNRFHVGVHGNFSLLV